MSTTKFHWMSWMSAVLRRLRKGDIYGAAWYLHCCTADGNERDSILAMVWERKMFTHPEVRAKAQELVDIMLEEWAYEDKREAIKDNLRKFGWRIT